MSLNPITITSIDFDCENFTYRAPMKFGGMVVERVTVLNVWCEIATGRVKARGFGSMPMGNVWAFPSKQLSYQQTLKAMLTLAERIAGAWRVAHPWPHPVQIGFSLEPKVFQAARDVTQELDLHEPIPELCALVVSSAFDAATCSQAVRLMPCRLAAASMRASKAVSKRMLTTVFSVSCAGTGGVFKVPPAMKASAFRSSAGFTMWGILIVIAYLLSVQRVYDG